MRTRTTALTIAVALGSTISRIVSSSQLDLTRGLLSIFLLLSMCGAGPRGGLTVQRIRDNLPDVARSLFCASNESTAHAFAARFDHMGDRLIHCAGSEGQSTVRKHFRANADPADPAMRAHRFNIMDIYQVRVPESQGS